MTRSLTDQDDIDRLVRTFSGLSPDEVLNLKQKWLPAYGGGSHRLSAREREDSHRSHKVQQALLILDQEVEKGLQQLEVKRQELLKVYAGSRTPSRPSSSAPYRHTHANLARRAKFFPADLNSNRVTDFTSWVHSLYGFSYGSAAALLEGKVVERKVRTHFRAPKTDERWELIYEDPLDEKTEVPTYFLIPALSIRGEAMRGRPDVVLRHKPTNALTIIERKSTRAEIPADGWPDLRAQLWCYAQIDHPAWLNASSIRLVGEVWVSIGNGLVQLREQDGGLMVWMKDNPVLEEQNAELFAHYKAVREGSAPHDLLLR